VEPTEHTVAGDVFCRSAVRWIPSERFEDVIEDFENLLAMMRALDPDFKRNSTPWK
jgi:hypothetical protein